jgi:His-Xaa-Ser system protein HxsD
MSEVGLQFPRVAYSADAIQRAAYRFCDRFVLDLEVEDDHFRCTLSCPDEIEPSTVVDFRKEVLDQTLRERIRSETEGVRNVILAVAFSNADLEY